MFDQFRRIIKHSAVYGLSGMLAKLIGFLLLPVYTHYLTPSDYGTLEIFVITTSFLSIIMNMGLGSALVRSYNVQREEGNRNVVINTALIFLIATSAILSWILVISSSNFSTILFEDTKYKLFFRIVFVTLFFNTVSVVPMAVLRIREESIKYSSLSILRFTLGMTLNIYFVVVLTKGVLGILTGGLVASVILFSAAIFTIRRDIKLKFSTSELKELLSYGFPLVPAALASSIITLSDRYFLRYFSTLHELGLYSLGYKLGMVVSLVTEGFGIAWPPILFSIYYKDKNAKHIYSRVLTYLTFVLSFLGLGISVLAKDVLKIMSAPEFHDAYKVVSLIVISYVL